MSILEYPDSEYNSAFMASFSSIMVSEIGDKTFFIAAIMAMRYSRLIAFCGSYAALFIQTMLSCLFGYILPKILPKVYTEALACLLFFFFGAKLVYDGLYGEKEGKGELQEVEEELEKVHSQMIKGFKDQASDKKKLNQPPMFVVFTQAFTLTFLAEWGDRSQITTIALSAADDAYIVFLGAAIAHFICTGMSVLAGKAIASKISENMISLMGGSLFLLFGIRESFHLYSN